MLKPLSQDEHILRRAPTKTKNDNSESHFDNMSPQVSSPCTNNFALDLDRRERGNKSREMKKLEKYGKNIKSRQNRGEVIGCIIGRQQLSS